MACSPDPSILFYLCDFHLAKIWGLKYQMNIKTGPLILLDSICLTPSADATFQEGDLIFPSPIENESNYSKRFHNFCIKTSHWLSVRKQLKYERSIALHIFRDKFDTAFLGSTRLGSFSRMPGNEVIDDFATNTKFYDLDTKDYVSLEHKSGLLKRLAIFFLYSHIYLLPETEQSRPLQFFANCAIKGDSLMATRFIGLGDSLVIDGIRKVTPKSAIFPKELKIKT